MTLSLTYTIHIVAMFPRWFCFNTRVRCNAWPEVLTPYVSDLRKFGRLPTFRHQRDSNPCSQDYRTDALVNCATYDQFCNYLKSNDLIYKLQSGFRDKYSTDTCLIYLTDYIRMQSDSHNYTGMAMLDLQKAFDTVNHEILLNKLQAMGVTVDSVKWFESYLCDRWQSVSANGCDYPLQPITCGVPQSSILGPLLFLAYVNDMQSSVN